MKSCRIASIAFCLLCFSSIGLRAQTYTPVAYNFGSVFEVTDGSGGDSATDLSMDCLTADGYGQWTASYKTRNHFDSGSPGLFLLANSLRAPASNTATGIVSSRPFANFYSTGYPVEGSPVSSVVKCASNLKGRVRYVWPSADHQHFIVEGFDECPANGNPAGLSGINLEFASYPYNTTYGDTGINPHLAKDVIKAPSAINANTINIALLTHPIVAAAYEANPKDWFDIAMDTTNLYIVWEEYDSTGHYNIWEVTEELSSGTSSTPIKVASGSRRPTISAEVRRATPADTLSKACFDVSYITGLLSTDHITWYNYDGARTPAADTMAMTTMYQDTAGTPQPYQKVMHARMLDASWEGIASSDTTPRAIYAIVADASKHIHLIMYKIKGGAQDMTAYYCDGHNITNHAPGVDDGKFDVIDKPIRAFVNPYDGEKNDNFDEYHCMYQLARTYFGGWHKPLMIIHGALVSDTLGPRVCLNYAPDITPPTATLRPNVEHSFYAHPGPNTDGGDSDNYVGAVNQMGIHTHWRSDSEHYYLLDQRKFDEDIEENTLATEDIYIDDGTSHGGTIGAAVLPGKAMTIYTDTSIEVGYGEATLHFPLTGINANITELKIGTGTGVPAKLVAVGHFERESLAPTQYLHIKANSSFDLHGANDQNRYHNGGIWVDGSGTTITGGPNGWPDSISNPATLNIHGGSYIYMGYVSAFVCTNGIVNVLKDQTFNVDTENISSGQALEITGTGLIDSSIFNRQDTSFSLAGSEYGDLLDLLSSADSLSDTLKIRNTYFHGGLVEAGVWGDIQAPKMPLSIMGGKFDNASLLVSPIPFGAIIQNVVFDSLVYHSYSYALGLEIGSWPSGYAYDYVTIQGCNFKRMDNGCDGIKVIGMTTDSSIMEHIHIVNDTFNYVGELIPHAAIELQSSEAFIQGNDIEGSFSYGIIISGTGDGILSPPTKSLVCTNIISGAAGLAAGIASDNTAGYYKMNSVTVLGTGHISGVNDRAHIIFSLYDGSAGNGLSVTDISAAPDLSGVHSVAAHVEDYAAFDTIEGNASYGVAQIALVKNANIYLGTGLMTPHLWTWSDWSRNNIVGLDGYGACGGSIIYDVPLIIADSGHSEVTELGNISRNFFGDSTILPENSSIAGCNDTTDSLGTPSSWQVGVSTQVLANGICYSADSNQKTWQNRIPGTIDCEASLPEHAKSKGANPQSILIDTNANIPCQERYNIGVAYNNENEFDSSCDYLTWYLESCYASDRSWQGFVDLDEAVQGMSTDPSRFENYREWLKSVLWLNRTDPNWYCQCALAIAFTYQWDSTAKGDDYNAATAVLYYLQSANRCPQNAALLLTYDSEDRAAQRGIWLDSVNQLHKGDTTDFPEDTTVPTLEQLGMEILRGPPASVQTQPSQTGIGSLTASENPFTKETTVSFSMGEYAYVSFQVFDLLGKVMQGDYKGSVIGPGEHSFDVDGTDWPSGTYYARITTPIGETRMIKLVKE